MPEEPMATKQSTSTTSRLISAYGEQEPWKEEHDRAMYCVRIEQNLEWGMLLFKGLTAAESRLQSQAERGRHAVKDADWLDIDRAYRSWAATAGKFLKIGDTLAAEGFSVDRLEDFRSTVAEAEAIVGNADIDSEIRPIEELERMARPTNPRPDRYRD